VRDVSSRPRRFDLQDLGFGFRVETKGSRWDSDESGSDYTGVEV